MNLSSDSLLVNYDQMHTEPQLDRDEGEVISLDYQDLYSSSKTSSNDPTTSLPSMAESGLNEYTSFYSPNQNKGLDLTKNSFQHLKSEEDVITDVIFEGLEALNRNVMGNPPSNSHKDIYSSSSKNQYIDLTELSCQHLNRKDSEAEMIFQGLQALERGVMENPHSSSNKEIISSSIKNIQDAITITNMSESSRCLIERSLTILKTAIEIGDKEEDLHPCQDTSNSIITLDSMAVDGLETTASVPVSALDVDEDAVREALGLTKVTHSFLFLEQGM